jgi:hypothetical protein
MIKRLKAEYKAKAKAKAKTKTKAVKPRSNSLRAT